MIQKPFRGTQLNRTHPLAKGLVGCWLFNEATGETVFDLSGNGNNGTLENGVTWGNGGLEFNGLDGYVSVSDVSLTDQLSVYVRAKSGALNTRYEHVISEHPGWGIARHEGTNKIRFFIKSGNEVSAYANNTLDTAWHHYIGVYDGSTVKLYVNGVPDDTKSQSGNIDSTGSTTIGAYWGDTSSVDFNWNGDIDNVRIYNRALSAEEVAWLHREPYAMFEPAFSFGTLYAALPPALKPMWYYNMLKRRNR